MAGLIRVSLDVRHVPVRVGSPLILKGTTFGAQQYRIARVQELLQA